MTTNGTVPLDSSRQERLAHYRRMASMATKTADASEDQGLRKTYLDIAAGWKMLAADTERHLCYAEGQPRAQSGATEAA